MPKELRWTKGRPNKARGTRTCTMCRDKIKKGDEFFDKGGYNNTFNVCMDCSYMSFIKLLKMVK